MLAVAIILLATYGMSRSFVDGGFTHEARARALYERGGRVQRTALEWHRG